MATLVLFPSDLIDPKQGPKVSNYREGILEAAGNSDIVVYSEVNKTIVLKSAKAIY